MGAVEKWEAAVAEGRLVYPALPITTEWLRGHGESLGLTEPPDERGADLCLACACASGDPAAIALFERHFLLPAKSSISRVRSDPDFVDEAAQVLRQKLLIGPPPRIAGYRAAAPLSAWVRIAATRMGLDLSKGSPTERPLFEDQLPPDLCSPELLLLKHTYRQEFTETLREAVRALSPRDRNVLRLHLAGGLTIDEIAVPYRVHRATVARWLVAIPARILGEVNRLLATRHPDLSAVDVEVLARLVESQLHLSLSGTLDSRATPPDPAGPGH